MSNASFLPEDYLARKSERRTNLISVVLFVVVMLGVFLAFLFTNQKWNQVKDAQVAINTRYQHAAVEIKELTELEELRDEMLQKADLAAALVETVPRSILLAELINRMPDRLSLLEFTLTSEKLKPQISRPDSSAVGRLEPTRAQTKEQASSGIQKKIRPPKYDVTIGVIGAAPTDIEVSKFLSELNNYRLLRRVSLEYSAEKEIEGQTMREFKISMKLVPGSDVREVSPRIMPRTVRDPMSDQLRIPASRTAPNAPGGGLDAGGGKMMGQVSGGRGE